MKTCVQFAKLARFIDKKKNSSETISPLGRLIFSLREDSVIKNKSFEIPPGKASTSPLIAARN